MVQIDLEEDIKPLSAFRANAAACIQQLQESGRPMVLTQHGRSAAVLLDVREYQRLVDKLALYEEVRAADRAIDEGRGVAHEAVRDGLLRKHGG